MVRTDQLQLNHWRRPLQLRTPDTEQMVYSASEKSDSGGSHETPVENPSRGTGIPEWTEPMGPSLFIGIRDCSQRRGGSDADEPGGATCE